MYTDWFGQSSLIPQNDLQGYLKVGAVDTSVDIFHVEVVAPYYRVWFGQIDSAPPPVPAAALSVNALDRPLGPAGISSEEEANGRQFDVSRASG